MDPFSIKSLNHVFAVLSQRLCLDPVMANAEAVELAERSVAHHMRLLTRCSDTSPVFFTHSPSEPILALASADILYNTDDKNRLADVLDELSRSLCRSGLVEKGILGELIARTLLLIARDFAAPKKGKGRDLLAPVPLMDFLCTLLGEEWAKTNQSEFETAFGNAYVNFTHWMITKDSMPEEPNCKMCLFITDSNLFRQLLTNLWARGAALQCCFRQEAVDFNIPIYSGSVAADAVFDPSQLSVISGQVKFTTEGKKAAEFAIRPIGIPCDPEKPLPYLTLLMELGNESKYQESHSKVKTVASEPAVDGEFARLTAEFADDLQKFESYKAQAKQELAYLKEDVKASRRTKKDLTDKKKVLQKAEKKLEEQMKSSRQAKDSYNRYSIAVRGASDDVYKILQTAKIVKEFDVLVRFSMPSANDQTAAMKHMRPLESLGAESNHTAWMLEYTVDAESMDVDV